MKKSIIQISSLSLLAATLLAVPAVVRAQDAATNVPSSAAGQPAPTTHKARKHDHTVFNGKLTSVDTNAMTLTVGERNFEITSETKITKAGQPATLADGVAGEPVAGTYKKSADGKLNAMSIRFGAKAEGENKKKKKANADSNDGSTNGVPN
jgi:hypothetical protein